MEKEQHTEILPSGCNSVMHDDSGTSNTHIAYVSASQSHVGMVRSVNEDACLELNKYQLWVVADGMGGHMAGDVASSTVINYAQAVPYDPALDKFGELVKNQLLGAHEHLRQMHAKTGRVSGCTVIALLCHDAQGMVMWAGDSRAYLSRQGTLYRLTRDHSIVEELLAMGGITPEEARNHPQANVITRAVGADKELMLDQNTVALQEGDKILLCSDGLTKEMEDTEIGMIMAQGLAPAHIVQELINTSLKRHARDNVTVIVVQAVRRA